MKRIISDFKKYHLRQLLSYVFVTAFSAAALALTGLYQNEKMRWQAIAITAFLIGITLLLYINVLFIAPARFKKEFAAMNDNEKLAKEYQSSKTDCGHHYTKNYLVFYRKLRIYAVKYTDILGIEGGTKNLFFEINGYTKTIVMPFDYAGPNAVAMAYIKNKNPKVKIICDRTVKDAD
ncbi:MAG: hypothetical protein E7478_01640 [Ruminococcaceae bacterium]|nr:hypothetical protein [Oscillospiraceae bacterium]